ASGFYFKILEDGASITLPAFDETTNPEITEGVVEGVQAFSFEVVEGPGYTIDPEASGFDLTIADNPDSLIQVSYSIEPATLIESESTVGVHTFSLSSPPPEEGVTISVSAPMLSEFDLDSIEVMGGEIVSVNEGLDGFEFKLTSQTATINLPVAEDGESEGLEEATFTVEPGDGYQVNPEAGIGTFSLVDSADQIPAPTEVSEPNDIIPLATEVGLTADNPELSITSTIDYENGNFYETENGRLYIDFTEDVDIYKVDLKAGDLLTLDADANQFEPGRKVDPWLRIFTEDGTELASNDDGAAPDEIFDSGFEPYIEFTAPEDGSYYVGVALYNNGEYDPLVPGSGTGNFDADPDGYGPGEYTLNFSLNNPDAFTPEPTEIPAPTGEGPFISLFGVTGTYNSDFDNNEFGIISTGLVETEAENTGSALNLVLTANGEVPEGGVEIFINSDIAFPDYFGGLEDEEFGQDYAVPYGGNLNNKPFTRGGQFLDAVYDENGEATGFKFRLEEPFATISLNPTNRLEPETDGPETATFFLEESAGYNVSPFNSTTATFYDTIDTAPVPTTTPEVSLEITPTELIESEETEFTLNLSLNEAPPPEGVQVYVSTGEANALGEFGIFEADIQGGVAIPDGNIAGFYFQMFDQNASITLPVFNSPDDIEGLEEYTFSIEPGAGYTVSPDNGSAAIAIKDTPDSQIQVSLSTEPEVLVESEETVSVHNFSLSAEPPEEGVTVSVNAPNLSEFNLDGIVVEGGEISNVTDDSFDLTLTAKDATISLPVANDGEDEGLEEVSFSLASGMGYQVDPEGETATFTVVDTPEQAPTTTEEANDTIPDAIATGLTSDNSSVSFEGEIGQYFAEDEEGNSLTVDASEDVDMYSFELNAGDTIKIDVDSFEYEVEYYEGPQQLDSQLRLFDSVGNELASVNNAAAPDEVFTANRDPYLEFTATETGTYFVGVSQLGNTVYDPFEAGTGSGRVLPQFGINIGEYDIAFDLVPGDGGGSEPDLVGTDDADTLVGDDADNTIDALGGDDLVAGLSGDDTVFGGSGDDVLRGDANSRSSGGSNGGDDVISGGAGNDRIGGKGGNDLLSGDEGDDEIFGDAGDDTIMGVTGNDTLTGDDFSGGSGSDLFVFGNGDGTDTITDFDITEDMIGLVEGELTFEELSITNSDAGAMISVIESGETLAVLQGVDSSELTEELFMVTPDVTFG
ncbi:MAG: pre-peptidase C-terminal domain-containing protein, partial [Lyngbya sp.]|nr:pre-peptidase C-terminal domain-containing protein [Lyngbya sp.]